MIDNCIRSIVTLLNFPSQSVPKKKSGIEETHLPERVAFGHCHLVDSHHHNWDVGGQRHEPANNICPHGVERVAILGWRVPHKAEDQDALKARKSQSGYFKNI